MNIQIIIASVIVIAIFLTVVLIVVKKERFVLNNSGLVLSSGKGTPNAALSYLISNNGNISSTTSGQFNNVDVEGNLTLQGYSGNVGDVLVSNGGEPPVWAPGVGLSDFVGKKQSINQNGYQIFPGGLIMQWGYVPYGWGSANTVVTFPIQFPNNCFNVVLSPYLGGSINLSAITGEANVVMTVNVTNTGFGMQSQVGNAVFWTAFGN